MWKAAATISSTRSASTASSDEPSAPQTIGGRLTLRPEGDHYRFKGFGTLEPVPQGGLNFVYPPLTRLPDEQRRILADLIGEKMRLRQLTAGVSRYELEVLSERHMLMELVRLQTRPVIAAASPSERVVFTPEQRGNQRGYRFSGEGTITELLTGVVPELSLSFLRDR